MADYYRPPSMPRTYLGVMSDFVEQLSLWSSGSTQATQQTLIRNAIIVAYRALVQEREWKYFQCDGRLSTNAPYSTGTISYTNSTRTVTLSGGTWPSWAGNGKLVVGNQVHFVAQRVDGTTLILDPQMNPEADLSAGTAYSLRQDNFDLPGDYRSLRQAITANNFNLAYIRPDDAIWRERRLRNSGNPQFFTIWPSRNAYAAATLAIYPFPDSAQLIDIPYQRFARPITLTGYGTTETAGTVTTSGTAVTGVGTSFSANMVGAVMRFGTSQKLPNGPGSSDVYQDQQVIVSVESSLALTLAAAPAQNYTNVKYRITDPVDIPEYMYIAFLRRCEQEVAQMLRMDRSINQMQAAYREALIRAFEADAQPLGTREIPSVGYYQWWNLGPAYTQVG